MGISLEQPNTRSKGNVGENVCCRLLVREGFRIVARNYQKKWGELDIVGLKDGVLHFFEVKSVTFRSNGGMKDVHVPEENVHRLKLLRIRRTARTFLAEWEREGHSEIDPEIHFHVLCVFLDLEDRKSRVKWIKDVIL